MALGSAWFLGIVRLHVRLNVYGSTLEVPAAACLQTCRWQPLTVYKFYISYISWYDIWYDIIVTQTNHSTPISRTNPTRSKKPEH